MIFRLLALIALPILALLAANSASKRFQLTARQNRILFVIVAALLVIGVLVIMGRLPIHFILAPLGAALAFLLRMAPALFRLLPLWQLLRGRMSTAQPRRSQQSSTIRTAYLAMELAHASGEMDGEVLQGQFSGKRLQSMGLEELLELAREVASDVDSAQVLEAYLDREHSDWREHTNAGQQRDYSDTEPEMNRALALEILGLEDGVSREEVVKAHRKLMQAMHPDRGGSDYLAQKINAAKECLLRDC